MSARRWLGWCAVGVLACGITGAIRLGRGRPAAAQVSVVPAGAQASITTTTVAASSTDVASTPKANTPHAAPSVTLASLTLDPPAVHAPAAGHYVYDARVDGATSTGTLDIRSISGGRTIEIQTVGETTRRRVLRWSASSVAVVSSGACTYATPPPELVLPLAKDASWRSRGTCKTGSGTLAFDERVRVSRAARVPVGGKPVDVWVIQRRSTVTASNSTARIVRQTARTDLFAPALGLVVYESGQSAAPDASGIVRNSTWELALHPS